MIHVKKYGGSERTQAFDAAYLKETKKDKVKQKEKQKLSTRLCFKAKASSSVEGQFPPPLLPSSPLTPPLPAVEVEDNE